MGGGKRGSRASPTAREKYDKGVYSRRNQRDAITYWFIRYTAPDGSRRKEKAATSKQDARDLLIQRKAEILNGSWVDPWKQEAGEGITFDAMADRFQAEYGDLRRSEYYKAILKPLRAYFGKQLLKDITPSDLDCYRQHCVKVDCVGPSTTRKRLLALCLVFKKARRWGVIDINPAADLEKPADPKGKTRYLGRDEWDKVRDAAEPWLRPILTVAVATGMRLKEVAGLTWENVDRERGLLYVSEDNKTGVPRAVPLTATVQAVLESRVRHLKSPYVFLDAEGQPYTAPRQRNRISQRTRAAVKAAKLAGVSFHTLRHTAGSWMAQAGYSAVQIAKVLGHASTATTDRYMHLAPDHLRAAVEAIDAVLQGPSGPISAPTQKSDESTEANDHASAMGIVGSAPVGR